MINLLLDIRKALFHPHPSQPNDNSTCLLEVTEKCLVPTLACNGDLERLWWELRAWGSLGSRQGAPSWGCRGVLAALPCTWLSGLTWGGVLLRVGLSCRSWCAQGVLHKGILIYWWFQNSQYMEPISLWNTKVASKSWESFQPAYALLPEVDWLSL